MWWTDPTGARHNEEIDPGFFDSFDVLYSFSGTWREVGASSALTDPGLEWIDEDAFNFANLRPARGVPLLPGTTHKVQRIIPAESGGPCEGEFTYFLDYTLRTCRL